MIESSISSRAYVRSAAIGVVAGMRSQLPLALLALAARGLPAGAEVDATTRILRKPPIQAATALLATGEMIGDKLPMTPSRLNPGPLGGRLALGALAGGILARQAATSIPMGAILGAAGAAAGAFTGYHLRAALGRATHLPDPLFGALEDAAAIGLGLGVTRVSGDG